VAAVVTPLASRLATAAPWKELFNRGGEIPVPRFRLRNGCGLALWRPFMSESTATSVPAPMPSAVRGLVFILGALTVIGPFAIDMYLPALPQIARELGADVGTVQLTLSVFLLGLAAGQAFLGPIVDRWGRRRPLLIGLGFFVVASIGCALAQSMASLLAWRLVMALGAAASMVVPRAVVRDHYDERDSARMYSLLMLILGVSPIFAPSVGGQLIGWTGWRGIFWVLAGLGIACAAAVAWVLPEPSATTFRLRAVWVWRCELMSAFCAILAFSGRRWWRVSWSGQFSVISRAPRSC
jgi:multidrug resistance protein